MKISDDKSSELPQPRCLVEGVVQILAVEPRIEAVTVRPADHSVSIATLGQREDPALNERVKGLVQRLHLSEEGQNCGLLTGKGDCSKCERPPHAVILSQIQVTQNPQATTLARVSCPTAPRFWHWKSLPLPKLVPRELDIHDDDEHLDEWKGQLAAALTAGLLTALAIFGPPAWSIWCFIGAYLAGSWFTVVEVWELLQQRRLDVHFLMLAVAAGSAAIGEWKEGAILLFLFSLAGALEHYAMGRTQKEIKALHRGAPQVATLLEEGQEREVPVDRLVVGQRLLLKPGALFPVDAEVVKGTTAADESNLTGESAPVEKQIGDTVLAGTMNLWGAVEAMVLRPAAQSALEKIIRLIREAQHQKAPSQRFTDRFGTGYTYAVLGLSFAVFLFWWLIVKTPAFVSTEATKSAFYRAMTLLVVASPCALVLSIPSAILAAIASAARRGVLFRGGVAVEKLAEVQRVALDKTGTLTTGELQVETVESFPAGRESEVLRWAVSLERLSTHPLARAITRHGKKMGIEPYELERFESVTGMGLQADYRGKRARLGRRSWLESSLGQSVASAGNRAEPGLSEVWLVTEDLQGRVVMLDQLREESRWVIGALKEAGLTPVVLTGDREAAAQVLRDRLGIQDVRAHLSPEEKVAAIREFTAAGEKVAMVGDGVNDAPSLAAAHVGVAMGARGSDAALEQADVVLMHDRLENFLFAYRVSQRARKVIRQNLVISLGTVVILAIGALCGVIPLTLGVIGHEGSTLVVVFNSLRLLISPPSDPSVKVKA